MKKSIVSIIIPTRNEEHNLARLIKSIKTQKVPYEIIVVDQESSDDTIRIAIKNGAKVIPTIKTAFYSPPSQSRNIGAKYAKGKYLLHLDSDMILQEGLLDDCVKRLENSSVVAVIIPEKDIATNFWAKCKKFERQLYYNTIIESARFIRKDIFNKIRGYNERISSGEDFDIQSRLSGLGLVIRANKNIYHNLGSISLVWYLKKKYNYGKTIKNFFTNSPSSINMKTYITIYLSQSYKFLRSPFFSFGFIIMRFLELISLCLGRIGEKIEKGKL